MENGTHEQQSHLSQEAGRERRPQSLTLIGWFLVTTACVSLVFAGLLALGFGGPDVPEVALTVMISGLIPIPLLYVILLIDPMVHLVSGIGVLIAQKWARWLYVAWTVAFLGVSFLDPWLKTTVIPGVMWLLVLSFFLFSGDANMYFRRRVRAAA